MIRLDTRKKLQERDIDIHQHTPNCATLNFGGTKVLVHISYFCGPPHLNRRNEGDIRIMIDIDPKVRKIRPRNFVSLCQTKIRNTLRETQAIQMESLCILEGKAVWYLTIDLRVIADDGNLISALFVSTSHILSTCRIPVVSTIGDQWIIHSLQDRDPVPLSIKQLPKCSAFSIFIHDTESSKSKNSPNISDEEEEEESSILTSPSLETAYDIQYSNSNLSFIADPLFDEEASADGSLIIIRDVANDFHRIEFSGPPLSIDQLTSLFETGYSQQLDTFHI